MLGIDVMYLSSSRFSNLDIFGSRGAHDTLMRAINNQPFARVLDVTMDTNSLLEVPNMTTQQLDFQLRDRSYNILSIEPNISFVLIID